MRLQYLILPTLPWIGIVYARPITPNPPPKAEVKPASRDSSSINGGAILPWVAALVVGVPVALWTGWQAYRHLTPYKKDPFDKWNTRKSVLDDLLDEGYRL